jgi:hypothetical protein
VAEGVVEELDELVRRLRRLPSREWVDHRQAVLDLLVTLAGDHRAPSPPDHGLADAVAVMGRDAVEAAGASADPEKAMAVRAALRTTLTAIGGGRSD